jgi:hypothetical protein
MSVIIQDIEVLDSKYTWLGYAFKMSDDSKNITCKISNIQNCCEKFGIYTNSNLDEFIGAEYHSVDIVKKRDEDKYQCYPMVIVEVTVHTNRGNIVVQLYNEHNGYYREYRSDSVDISQIIRNATKDYYRHDFFIQSEHGQKIENM